MTFLELVTESKRRFAEHDFDGVIEIHLSPAQAVRVTRELPIAMAAIESAFKGGAPDRPGARLFATVDGIHVYVRAPE